MLHVKLRTFVKMLVLLVIRGRVWAVFFNVICDRGVLHVTFTSYMGSKMLPVKICSHSAVVEYKSKILVGLFIRTEYYKVSQKQTAI